MSKVSTATSDWMIFATPPVTVPPFTLHAWCKHTALGANENIVVVGTSGSSDNRYYTLKNSSNVLQAIERDTNSSNANSATIADTNWHAYTGVFTDDSNRAAFVDGGSKGSLSQARAPTTPNIFYVGRTPAGTASNFFGKMAYVAVWNRALSDSEVSALSQTTPLLAAPSGLIHYYILLNDANDSIGSSNLTVNGSAGFDAEMPPLNNIPVTSGTVTIAGKTPTVSVKIRANLAPSVGLARIAGNTPGVLTNRKIPTTASATVAGLVPHMSIVAGPSGRPDPALVQVVGKVPTFKKIKNVAIAINTSDADEEGLVPTIVQQWNAFPIVNATPAKIAGLQPLMIKDGTVRSAPSVGLVRTAGLAPTMLIPAGQSGRAFPTVNPVQAIGLAPFIDIGWHAQPAPAILSFANSAPELGIAGPFWHDPPPTPATVWHSP